MADASEEIAKLNIDMFNIHASAGIKAMNIVMDRLKPLKKRPLVLAVTALTSFDNASFKKIYNDTISNKALEFAKDTYSAGLYGVVCSVYESELIKNATHNNYIPLDQNTKIIATISNLYSNTQDLILFGLYCCEGKYV